MSIEFIIHGTTKSGQVITATDDQNYYRQFYNGNNNKVVMSVEILNRPHGACTYYNYLRYKNIFAERQGSYFGMTFRTEGMVYINVKSMYYILDSLFENCIVGNILGITDQGYKYIVDSLTSGPGKEAVEAARKQLLDIMRSFFSVKDYKPISASKQLSGQVLDINLYDLTQKHAIEYLGKRVKLNVSPFIPLQQFKVALNNKDKELGEAQNRIRNLEREKENIETRLSGEISAKRFEIERLKTKKEELELDNRNLKNENNRSKEKILNAIAEIKDPITRLAGLCSEYLPQRTTISDSLQKIPETERPHTRTMKSSILWFIFFAVALIIIIALFSGYRNVFNKTSSKSNITTLKESDKLRNGTDNALYIIDDSYTLNSVRELRGSFEQLGDMHSKSRIPNKHPQYSSSEAARHLNVHNIIANNTTQVS